jgi:DNA mismatch endonuclease Vsr
VPPGRTAPRACRARGGSDSSPGARDASQRPVRSTRPGCPPAAVESENRAVPSPEPSSDGVSGRMSRQLRTGTTPEMELRRELHRRGLRFRVDHRIDVEGLRRRRADIVFTRKRIAVFVDGCFWHACPDHATSPKANGTLVGSKARGQRGARPRHGPETCRSGLDRDPGVGARGPSRRRRPSATGRVRSRAR